jgi:hypothetical protein
MKTKTASISRQSELADDEEKLLHPNAFVSEDPKQILTALF